MRHVTHSLIAIAPMIAFIIGLRLGSFGVAVIGLLGLMVLPAILVRSEELTDGADDSMQIPLANIPSKRAA